MFSKKKLQQIILRNVDVPSEIERSRILFSAGAIVVITLISFFFLAYDIFLGYHSSIFIYTPFVLIFGYSMQLLRRGKHDVGRFILLFALNFFIYIVMSSIPEDSMSAIFYIAIIVVEYVLLDHDKKWGIFALLSLSFALYLIDTFIDFSLLPTRQYDENTLQVNKIIDFVICAIGMLLTIKLLIDNLQHIISERTRNNRELQRLNNELDRYSYTITHDLKGPIISLRRLIQLPILDKSNYDQHIGSIKESLENLWELIEDVSEERRNRTFEVKKESFNISETVEVIWELLRYAPEAQRIKLRLNIPKELKVETDKRRIIGIVNNLFTNSIRYQDRSKNNRYIKVSGFVMGN